MQCQGVRCIARLSQSIAKVGAGRPSQGRPAHGLRGFAVGARLCEGSASFVALVAKVGVGYLSFGGQRTGGVFSRCTIHKALALA